jgi:hypothetical protein
MAELGYKERGRSGTLAQHAQLENAATWHWMKASVVPNPEVLLRTISGLLGEPSDSERVLNTCRWLYWGGPRNQLTKTVDAAEAAVWRLMAMELACRVPANPSSARLTKVAELLRKDMSENKRSEPDHEYLRSLIDLLD